MNFLTSMANSGSTSVASFMMSITVSGCVRQLGVVHRSASSPKRWQDTLNAWLVKPEAEGGGGYTQGKNDPCLFYHKRLKVTLASYVNDLTARGQRKNCVQLLSPLGDPFASPSELASDGASLARGGHAG